MILYQTMKKERLKGRKRRLGLMQVLARKMETEIRRKEEALERLTRVHATVEDIRKWGERFP